MLLTCMPADRANVGRTGIGLDAWLSDKLGARGLLGSARRVGMSDLFHCFDGCARKVWDGHATGRKEARRLEQDSETEESSLSEDADLAPDHWWPKIVVPGGTRMVVYSSFSRGKASRILKLGTRRCARGTSYCRGWQRTRRTNAALSIGSVGRRL